MIYKKKEEINIAILGAGGKMGCRITDNLINEPYQLYLCEEGEHGISRLKERGLTSTPSEMAIPVADLVILAVPDTLIRKITSEISHLLKDDSTLILLDPAAAYANQVEAPDDCTIVVTHPCHPKLFSEQKTPEARKDMFGGIAATQDIVIALYKGAEDNFIIAEQVSKEMFAPVEKCFRITVEQMAILEPSAAEVVVASAACLMKESLDEAVKMGVPEEAARSFMLGHIQIPLAIVFNDVNPFSDAAKVAIEYGYEKIFKDNWKEIFTKESRDEVIRKMLNLEESNF